VRDRRGREVAVPATPRSIGVRQAKPAM
jgi:hypothetical protein